MATTMTQIEDITLAIIDDEPEICQLLNDLSQDMVKEIHMLYSGESALEFFKTNKVDIAIIDIRMPGVDGISLLREIKQLHPNLVAVIHSGFFDNQNMRMAIRHDAHDLLIKPVDYDDFRFAMTRYIDKVKTDRALYDVLETLLYATSSKIKPADFHKLPAESKRKALEAMLAILKLRLAKKELQNP